MNNVIRKTDGITSIPKFTIQGKSYVNLLGKDGSFLKDSNSDGLSDNFGVSYANNLSLNSGIQSFIATAQYGGIVHAHEFIEQHIYYACATVKSTSNQVGMTMLADTGGINHIWHNGDGTFRKISKISRYIEADASSYQNFACCDYSSSDWNEIQVKEMMLVDLTLTFGEGNEPSISWCDVNLPYIDSYACLENPYIEVRHDNLVQNGNCEEGVAWWILPYSNKVDVDNGKFKVTSTVSGTGVRQIIQVKPNTNYYISANVGSGSEVYVFDNPITMELKSVTDAFNSVNGEFNSGDRTTVTIELINTNIGTGYFDSIMLIEGTTPPIEYKPCHIERTVIEGKVTSDDNFTYESGKVNGLLNWKHKTLYGKDYDWQINSDADGLKEIGLTNKDFCIASSAFNTVLTKYDGSIMKNVGDSGSVPTSANKYRNAGYLFLMTLSNSDTGWTETLNPNADEVKSYMNGWGTLYSGQTRYTAFYNKMTIGTNKTDWANNSCVLTTVPFTSGQTILTVDDGSIFKAGDMFAIIGYTNATAVVSVSGNVLTVSNFALNIPVGVIRCDNPDNGDLRNLNYCKKNIAPNYEGYQLHYKLQNPEPITDVNTHIYGDIPKLDNGDNYLYLDYGMVLGEIANVAKASQTYNINCGYQISNELSFLKHKLETHFHVYKNNIIDGNWKEAVNNPYAYGKGVIYTYLADYDPLATYTVDYQILKTLNTSPTSIGVSYRKDVLNAISDLAEIAENKQNHDSALDNLVDLSVYEKVTFGKGATNHFTPVKVVGGIYLAVELPFKITKRTIPTIIVSNLSITRAYDNVNVTNLFPLYQIVPTKENCILKFVSYNSTDVTQWYSGYYGSVTITADCRGRL